jgi:hypothetical protein
MERTLAASHEDISLCHFCEPSPRIFILPDTC